MKYDPERLGETTRYGVTHWKFRIRKMRHEHGRYRYYLGGGLLRLIGIKNLKVKRVWEWLGICEERCPECGEYVPDFFDHVDADCPLV